MNAIESTVVLIPAYEPDERLTKYVRLLREKGAAKVVVVNDGSSEKCSPIFREIETYDGVQVIQYAQNGGKGHALRVGLRWIQENTAEQEIRYIVTADADGQHRAEDVVRVAEATMEDEGSLWLGSRDFSRPDIPPKSRVGNRTTSVVFKLLYGQWISDTQTGLRGFARHLLPMMCEVAGDRYEYEMRVLIECSRAGIPMKSVTIETIYENNNEGTHFHPIRDSYRIYSVILGQFLKFISSSLICVVVDYGCYLLINHLLEANCPQTDRVVRFLFFQFMLRITIATFGARIISSVLNFILNRKLVFQSDGKIGKSGLRYLCVVLLNMILSAALTSSMHVFFGASEKIIKLPVDLILFFLSYYLQRRWVFKKDGE